MEMEIDAYWQFNTWNNQQMPQHLVIYNIEMQFIL